MTADLPAQPLDLDAIRARAAIVAARRHHWARESGIADVDVIADLRRAKELAVDDVPALLAEMERLRQLLGQTTAALNVALHYAMNEPNWHDMPDADGSRTELAGCREALGRAVAELHPQEPTTPKPESAALIAAVDKLTEGSA